MIARLWRGRVPLEHASGFQRHLLDTGVADCRRQPGCVDVLLGRRDERAWAVFLLVSVWLSADAMRAFAGDEVELAVRYRGDDAFQLVSDRTVTHYQVVSTAPASAS